jgi:hypothetical protein
MRISPLWLIVAAIFAAWAYFGFPSPDTLSHLSTAQDECVKFAEKNKEKLFFTLLGEPRSEIKAMSSWMKNGRVVVELGAFKFGDQSYTPRICVVGGGSIQIVSILENNAWR